MISSDEPKLKGGSGPVIIWTIVFLTRESYAHQFVGMQA